MDEREAMALSSGSAQYYIHRGGVSGSNPNSQTGGFNAPLGFRPMANPNILGQSSALVDSVGASFPHGINMGVSSGPPSGELVKKKRGRPRKYGPDGSVSFGLSPLSAKPTASLGWITPTQSRGRGRPPGSGRRQQLASLGEWMNSSAGLAFAPHVITIGVGEDIAAKLLSFSQQRPRAVCVLSGSGTVSSVTLHQPASSGCNFTYEGRFEILCLSGSYLLADDSGPHHRTGGISVSVSSSDGYVIGGGVGMLIAASPVQVVVCSFVYGGSKAKNKMAAPKVHKESVHQLGDKSATTTSTPNQNYTPSATGVWPNLWPVDLRNPHTDIDLMRG